MNKRLCASCLVFLGAAGLCYWLWWDAAPAPGLLGDLKNTSEPRPLDHGEAFDRFSAGEIIEVIDLSRAFEPTGDELALKFLLEALDEPELLHQPRSADPELLPSPRLATDREMLPLPRLAVADRLPEAGEEASETPNRLEMLRQKFDAYLSGKLAVLLSELLPLKGAFADPPDDSPPEQP